MKLVTASLIVLMTTSAAFADYSHRWVQKSRAEGQTLGHYVGVEITNTGSRKISCNVSVRVQQCFGWSCDTRTKGGHTGIIYPGSQRISGWYAGAGSSYKTSCSYVN
jgi:hypothetical protein